MLQTVHKAAEVLNFFSVEHPEWGISELSKALSFPKSSTLVRKKEVKEQRKGGGSDGPDRWRG